MILFKSFLLILSSACAIGEKILVLHPVYAGSHIHAVRTILEELVNRGHQVRVIRWLESSKIPVINSSDFSETILSVNNSAGNVPFFSKEEYAVFEFPGQLMWNRGLNPLAVFDGGMPAVAASCDTLLQNKALIQDLKEQKFHVAFVDIIYNECGLALAHHLKLPVVGYWGLIFMSGETQYMTPFNSPSVIPHTYLSFNSKMNFFQRIINVLYGIGSHIVMQIHFYYTDFYIGKYLPGSPTSSELLSEISGMLINSHPAFDYPKQLPPSFFQIGGIHIKDHKSVQGELLEFMETAKDGVILFSLGLNFDSQSLPKEQFESYFEAFGKLKQKVIVKSRSVPEKIPSNVKIMSYVPQCDILAHPHTILFITHCGMHGVMEAIHHGVKMVGIPLFFDQVNVAARLKEKEVAIILDKQVNTYEIYQAINTVINDKSYDENMKRMYNMYHHSLENPMTRAVWLIEHVLEFRGAQHLKMDSKNYNFFQYFCLDVAVFLTVFMMLLCYLIRKLFVSLCAIKKTKKSKTL